MVHVHSQQAKKRRREHRAAKSCSNDLPPCPPPLSPPPGIELSREAQPYVPCIEVQSKNDKLLSSAIELIDKQNQTIACLIQTLQSQHCENFVAQATQYQSTQCDIEDVIKQRLDSEKELWKEEVQSMVEKIKLTMRETLDAKDAEIQKLRVEVDKMAGQNVENDTNVVGGPCPAEIKPSSQPSVVAKTEETKRDRTQPSVTSTGNFQAIDQEAVGKIVLLKNLQQAQELNGKVGTIIGTNQKKGRFAVMVEGSDKDMSIRPKNLEFLDEECDDHASSNTFTKIPRLADRLPTEWHQVFKKVLPVCARCAHCVQSLNPDTHAWCCDTCGALLHSEEGFRCKEGHNCKNDESNFGFNVSDLI